MDQFAATGIDVVRRTLNSRIILVNKVRLNELDRKRAFSDTTAADDNEFVFTEKLCLINRSGGQYETRRPWET